MVDYQSKQSNLTRTQSNITQESAVRLRFDCVWQSNFNLSIRFDWDRLGKRDSFWKHDRFWEYNSFWTQKFLKTWYGNTTLSGNSTALREKSWYFENFHNSLENICDKFWKRLCALTFLLLYYNYQFSLTETLLSRLATWQEKKSYSYKFINVKNCISFDLLNTYLIPLRELIFAGTNFRVFGCLPRKLVPRNTIFTKNL